MPGHLELDEQKKGAQSDICTPTIDFLGDFEKGVVVVSNLISRAATRWSLEESKLFMLAVSRFETRDKDCWVTLDKKEVWKALGIDPTNASQLKFRNKLKSMKDKSGIALEGATAHEYQDGQLIRKTGADRNNLYIQFDDSYTDLIGYVTKTLFTQFEVKNILGLKTKAGYSLYLYLTSWHNQNYLIDQKNISKSEIPNAFGLKEGQYWRKWGTPEAKFDWASFETKALNPAIKDINENSNCDMHIHEDELEKVKDHRNLRTVLGYHLKWHYTNPDGTYKMIKHGQTYIGYQEPSKLDLMHCSMFMKRFKVIPLFKLEELSKLLGTIVNPIGGIEYPKVSVEQLQREQQGNMITLTLCRALQNAARNNRQELGNCLGYQDLDDMLADFDSLRINLDFIEQ